MPNGNLLLIVWERKTAKQALEAGVKPAAATGEKLVDSLFEIKPEGKTGGQIVWEWHLWNHLIQDEDKSKANYGDVARHPELVDVNYAWTGGFGGLAQFLAPPPPRLMPKKTRRKPTPWISSRALATWAAAAANDSPASSRIGRT
jgi:hypothetical protein